MSPVPNLNLAPAVARNNIAQAEMSMSKCNTSDALAGDPNAYYNPNRLVDYENLYAHLL